MQKTSATQSDYAREIAKIVAAMPLDRAAKVYDFARFILQRPGTQVAVPNADDGWLNDSPEQIAREEAGCPSFPRKRESIPRQIKNAMKPLFPATHFVGQL